jgi:Cu-Zn family superoxide dismutase
MLSVRGALCSLVLLVAVSAASAAEAEKPLMAQAYLYDSKGDYVGKVTFEETDRGVKIVALIDSLPPGTHAFHIHERGVCITPDFKSAGGHFNPQGAKHGFLNPDGPHAGDLPNIVIGTDGTGAMEIVTARVTLKRGEKNSLMHDGGTAVVIHSGPDDYITDPAGAAGSRIACGAIKIR